MKRHRNPCHRITHRRRNPSSDTNWPLIIGGALAFWYFFMRKKPASVSTVTTVAPSRSPDAGPQPDMEGPSQPPEDVNPSSWAYQGPIEAKW
jgi:hypothetical protein